MKSELKKSIGHPKGKVNIKRILVISILIIALLIIVYLIWPKGPKITFNTQLDKYVETAEYRDITQYASIAGSVQSYSTDYITSDFDVIVDEIYLEKGDYIQEGQLILTVNKDDIQRQIDEKADELEQKELEASQMDSGYDYYYIKAMASGRLKDIKIKKNSKIEDVMNEFGYVALISTENKMQIKLEDQYSNADIGDEAVVLINGNNVSGIINKDANGTFNVIIESDRYKVGENVTVKIGNKSTEGTLELVSFILVRGVIGEVTSVEAKENEKVNFGEVLFKAKSVSSDLYIINNEINKLLTEISSLNKLLDDPSIYSNVNGIVKEIFCKPNDDISESEPFIEVLNPDDLYIQASVDEMDYRNVAIGQQVDISVDALPKNTYTGAVKRISNVGEIRGDYAVYGIDIELDSTNDLLVGMSAMGRIHIQSRSSVLTVPIEAIYIDKDGNPYVVLVNPSLELMQENISEGRERQDMKYVEIGIRGDEFVEITSGLVEGEKVIVEGISLGTVQE